MATSTEQTSIVTTMMRPHPNAVEVCDGKDNDCNGDGNPDAGIAANPDAVSSVSVSGDQPRPVGLCTEY